MFRVISGLEQGTEDWLQFRRKHVTATDSGKILGEVPPLWGNVYSCWHDKIMDIRIEPNEAMKKGSELEPFARTAYNEMKQGNYTPACVVSLEHSWMMSSLDALSKDCKSAAEFKCPGETSHRKAQRGKMQNQYIPQMQHHMSILGLDQMDFCSYFCDELIILTIRRDQKYIDNLIEKTKEFYDCLINITPPEVEEKIMYEEESSEKAKEIKLYLEKHIQLKKDIEKTIIDYKNDLMKIADGRNIKVDNLKIRKTIRSGSVQYGKIEELQGVDLNLYRNKPTEFYTFNF